MRNPDLNALVKKINHLAWSGQIAVGARRERHVITPNEAAALVAAGYGKTHSQVEKVYTRTKGGSHRVRYEGSVTFTLAPAHRAVVANLRSLEG